MFRVEKITVVLLLFLSALLYAHGASVLKKKDLNETNSLLSSIHSEIAEECDCGVYGICHFEDGHKKCTCAGSTAELDGKCIECNCGLEISECRFRSNGTKVCYCGSTHIDVNGQCRECYCGTHGLCRFEFGQKKCLCRPGFIESDGECVANKFSTPVTIELSSLTTTILTSTVTSCDCGLGGLCHLDSSGEKICNCFSGYAPYNGRCNECDCGSYGMCNLENELKKCICDENYAEKNGKCEYCSCGENSKSCQYNVLGEKECNCSSAYAQNHGYCEECNCGPYGSCSFEYDRKRCKCKSFAVEKNGVCVVMESTTLEGSTATRTTVLPSTTPYCNCGDYSKSCRYNLKGDKICDCFPGYVEDYGTCEECNCGPYGSCSFKDGQKRCHCISFAVEMNGVCVDKGTSLEGTTDSTTTYTIGSTTVKECDCGRLGRCTFEYGRKKCICDSLTWEKNGKCVECNCGKNTKSCHFDWKGDKACNCNFGYAQVSGICEDCKCGANARSCFFRDNGIKVCNCDFGYIETNGYCSAICNEDKCIHGKCEIVGNGFKCRCNEGFTGERCEEKIQTKSSKQNLWMVLVLSGVFAIVILLSCMICFWTRILNKMSKK